MTVQTVTWDPVNKGGSVTLSNGNLTATSPNTSNTVRASLGRATGKWYLEIKADSVSQIAIGIVNTAAGVGSTVNSVNSMYYLSYGGTKIHNTSSAYGTGYTTGDIVSILLNLDNGTIEFWKNGISQGVAFTTVSTLGQVFPAVIGTSSSAGGTVTANFGASKFTYEIPKGYFSYDGRQYGSYNKFLILSGQSFISYKKNEKKNAVPKMTSNTSPSGVVEQSSYFNIYLGWRAFNESAEAYGWYSEGTSPNQWISYEFTESKVITSYELTVGYYKSPPLYMAPRSWNLEAWDGEKWVVLDRRVDVVDWVGAVKKEFFFNNRNQYRKYRLFILSSVGGTAHNVTIDQFSLYETAYSEMLYLPDSTNGMFINYGMDKNTSIELFGECNLYKYINNTPTTLGLGKVFKQRINPAKTPIKGASIN